MENRPVVVRTDESAEDFWKRIRHPNQVDEKFRVVAVSKAITPYNRQRYLYEHHKRVQTSHDVAGDVRHRALSSSRDVERRAFGQELRDADCNMDDNLRVENIRLRARLDHALKINAALAKGMVMFMK